MKVITCCEKKKKQLASRFIKFAICTYMCMRYHVCFIYDCVFSLIFIINKIYNNNNNNNQVDILKLNQSFLCN